MLLSGHPAAAAKSLQSCPTLCNPVDSSPPGSPVPGILQARTLEWVAISFSSAWEWKVKVKSLSRVRLFVTPMDCSLPRSSVYGIFQARVLEWGAIAFSRGSSQPRDRTRVSCVVGRRFTIWATMEVRKKIKIELPHGSVILLLSIYGKNTDIRFLKTY